VPAVRVDHLRSRAADIRERRLVAAAPPAEVAPDTIERVDVSTSSPALRLLGLDIGRKRIGLAWYDPADGMVRGLDTLQRKTRDEDLGRLARIARERGETIRLPAYPADVVDTTGAGDSFVAGFLHAWLRGQDIQRCLQFASACGALSTQGVGGTGSQPRLPESWRGADSPCI